MAQVESELRSKNSVFPLSCGDLTELKSSGTVDINLKFAHSAPAFLRMKNNCAFNCTHQAWRTRTGE